MSAITLVVTAAGRAALVNAAAAGTNAVTIAQAGFTSLAFTASGSMVGVPGEFGRVSTIAGAAVDPDTIHLFIRDESSAAYDLRGFGLYLADGTLFALYGQATPILEKSASSTALIAVDVRFADIAATSLEFGGDGFLNPPATTSVQGVVELATNAEAVAGSDLIRAITPATLKAAIDARFGPNAASEFVRTLLGRATQAEFRTGLGLRSAALRDEGAGNGLDADLLDGRDGSFYTNIPARLGYTPWHAGNDGAGSGLDADLLGGAGPAFYTNIPARLGYTPWHVGNDGAGSGLDADLLDGQDGSFYANITARLGYTPWHAGNDGIGSGLDADLLDGQDGSFYTNIPARLGYTPWHAGNDGAGSGLDADLLDGRDAASFANAAHSHGAADLLPAFADRQLQAEGWQALPGGLLMQWGRYAQFIAAEGSIQIWFPRAFAGEPFTVQLTGLNTGGSNNRDMLPQLIAAGAGGALVYIQMPDSGAQRPLDGFLWFAIGLAGNGPGGAAAGGGSPIAGGGGGGGDPGGGDAGGGGGDVGFQ